MRTGQVRDYLAYKEQTAVESAESKAGEIREFGYAGVCNSNRDCKRSQSENMTRELSYLQKSGERLWRLQEVQEKQTVV